MPPVTSKYLNRAFSALRYYMAAGDEHQVHSPFLFRLLTDAIYLKTREPVFDTIENFRRQLLRDKRVIEVSDLGAGSSFDGKLTRRSISDITRKFAKSPKHCRFLYRFIEHLKPGVMIELGTSLGISAMYQASGNTNGKLYTLEGCPWTAEVARENFIKNKFTNITCITGNFDVTFPDLLNQLQTTDYVYIDGNHTYEATLRYFKLIKKHVGPKSVIIFDDIYWSGEMAKAWNEIKSDPEVTMSVDFYQFGVVFFDKNLAKQHFILKL